MGKPIGRYKEKQMPSRYYKSMKSTANGYVEVFEICINKNLGVQAIVNALFACELYLKAILFLQEKKFNKGHKLSSLTVKIKDSGLKDKIVADCECKDEKELLDKIKNIDDMFIELRYFFEKEIGAVSFGFIKKFMYSLKNIVNELDFIEGNKENEYKDYY